LAGSCTPCRVYVYLSPKDAVGAAGQFSGYGILEQGEVPGAGEDRISGVPFIASLAKFRTALEAWPNLKATTSGV
jgi:hypothetical protein